MVKEMQISVVAVSQAGCKPGPFLLLLVVVGLLMGSAVGQPSVTATSVPKNNLNPKRLADKDVVGPLILRALEPHNHWMMVDWDPKSPVTLYRVGGQDPAEYPPVSFLLIQLSHIEPLGAEDAGERERLRQIYVKGVEKILANQRRFWFYVTNTGYAGPGQIGGLLFLDDPHGDVIQLEMVRSGYAVVSSHDPAVVKGNYAIDFRDKLLRLEGAARAQKLEIWAKN